MENNSHNESGWPSHLQNETDTLDSRWTPQAFRWTPKAFIAVFTMTVLLILTVSGNFLVIVAVVMYKRLQIPSNYLLVNLATADIAVLAFAPLALATELDGNLFASAYTCVLPYCLVVLGCGVSLLSLGIVAYDRYSALVKPLKYCQHITAKRVLYISLAIWLYVFFVSLAPLWWLFFKEQTVDLQKQNCNFYLFSEYMILVEIVMLFVPAIVTMLGCYCRVMLVARHHTRAISAIQLSLFPNSFNKNFHMFKGTKYSRTLLIILGFFCVTWVTFVVTLLVERFCHLCQGMVPLHQYTVFLIFANSCLNPWIYASRNQDFKAAFRRLFRSLCSGKKRSQSSNQGPEGRRNSRVSDGLSRTNSMMEGLQHLHALYDNADIVPTHIAMEACKPDSKVQCNAKPKLIEHGNGKPVNEIAVDELTFSNH